AAATGESAPDRTTANAARSVTGSIWAMPVVTMAPVGSDSFENGGLTISNWGSLHCTTARSGRAAPIDDQHPAVRGQRSGLHGELRGRAYGRMGVDSASAISLRQPGDQEGRGVGREARRRGHD